MAAAPFFFQILLADRKTASDNADSRSIVVEVSPEIVTRAGVAGQNEKPERDFAEEMALRVAAEVNGWTVLAVMTENDEVRKKATRILKKHGARFITFFGRFVTQVQEA